MGSSATGRGFVLLVHAGEVVLGALEAGMGGDAEKWGYLRKENPRTSRLGIKGARIAADWLPEVGGNGLVEGRRMAEEEKSGG